VSAAPSADEFISLPKGNTTLPMPSHSYSGYLNVTMSKRLHYIFVESLNNPVNDPIIVWFNGGPGCSSLLAFISENGPFKIDDNSTVGIEPND
jgi:carboxypeptidase C (cathepsin A)